jgi:flavin-dependent dehydrogenase
MSFDIAIIGGGIVGAATFYKLQTRYPDLSIVLIEKERTIQIMIGKTNSLRKLLNFVFLFLFNINNRRLIGE